MITSENSRMTTFEAIPNPFDQGYLPVGGGHELYYEQSGNPNGVAVVHLHGGPGDGSKAVNRQLYDQRHCRLIQLDQRGAGRSKPPASTIDNTTQNLIDDLEKLRRELTIDRWIVAGGSWGSYLAMVYAIHNPAPCLGLVLRGVLLGHPSQVDWWFNGRSVMFPDCHERFMQFVPKEERSDLLKAYYARLMDPDPAIHVPATISLRNFMVPMRSLQMSAEGSSGLDIQHALNVARLWTHYCVNGFFLEEGFILKNIDSLRTIPSIIVQGRYDIVTPMRDAFELHRAWPEADFVVVSDGGHSTDDASIAVALSAANQRMLDRVSKMRG